MQLTSSSSSSSSSSSYMPTNHVLSFCVIPYFDIFSYCRCFRVSRQFNECIRHSIQCMKTVILYGNKTDCRTLRLFAKYAKSLRIIDVRLSSQLCIDVLCDLIRESSHLEAFLSNRADDRILDTLIRYCPRLIALALCTANFSIINLMKFKNLKAIELGCSREIVVTHTPKLVKMLNQHPDIVIVHILSTRSTLKIIDALTLHKIRSISCPYDKLIIGADDVKILERFRNLENLNFGDSAITEATISQVSKTCTNLRKFSLTPRKYLKHTLARLSDRNTFTNLEILGCRTPKDESDIIGQPVTMSAFSETGEQRDWDIIDYAIEKSDSNYKGDRDHWCRTPFDFATLLVEYGLINVFK